MGRILRRLLAATAIGGLLLTGTGFGLWVAIQPPRVPVPPRSDLVFVDVTVVNPGSARLPGRTLEIRNGRIEALRPARPDDVSVPPTLDLRGTYVLPGLIDMHVHLFGESRLPRLLYLAHGVTAIRDVGSPGSSQIELREKTRGGELAGPRVFTCDAMLDGDPPVWPFARVVRTRREARAAVAALAGRGADCVKVYEQLEAPVLEAVREAAAEHGLPVVGHVPFGVPFAEAGIDDIQHLTGVAELVDPDYASWAEKASAWGRLGPTHMQHVVEVSRRQDVAHTPTLVIQERQAQLGDYDRTRNNPAAQLLPRFWREVVWNPCFELGDWPSGEADRARYGRLHRQVLAKQLELVGRLHRAGAPIHVGTDPFNAFVVPGAAVHEEMTLLRRAGLTPAEAWAAATRVPGSWLSDDGLGTVAAGAPADLLVFRRDPTRDLERLDDVVAVIADGRLYTIEFLQEELARQREHFESPLVDAVTMSAARLVMPLLAKGDDSPGETREP